MRAVVVLVVLAGIAHADPWARGVSADAQARAEKLFEEGNLLFAQEAHTPALDKYREAIALWDHPLVRFNMAVTLVRLDRFVEAAESIDRALAYGAAPFPRAEQHRQALDYQKLIAGRVGTIEVTCAQPAVRITLDGASWFACPRTERRRVLAGDHVIVAEADGYLTRSTRVAVTGGKDARILVELVRYEAAVTYRYPRPRWIPWTVAGGGVVVALVGGGVYLAGSNQLDRFRDEFARVCAAGCMADLSDHPALRDQRDSAQLKGRLGIGLLIGGGAAAVAGAVWALVLNRPERVLPVVEPSSDAMTAGVQIRF